MLSLCLEQFALAQVDSKELQNPCEHSQVSAERAGPLRKQSKSFPGRAERAWHTVPREAVAAPGSLEMSKARLDRAWSNLG